MPKCSCLFFFIYGQTGALAQTQTSFTNAVVVFSESARSEAVRMTTHYIDRSVNCTILLSCLGIQNYVTSTFGCQGKCMGVNVNMFFRNAVE